MNASSDPTTDEPLETFVTNNIRIVEGVVAGICIWIGGFTLTRHLWGKPDELESVILGIIMTLCAGWCFRYYLRHVGIRVLIHTDAIGLFRRGEMKIIPWSELVVIGESSGFITLVTEKERFTFDVGVFKKGGRLKRVLFQQAGINRIPWNGAPQADQAAAQLRVHQRPLQTIESSVDLAAFGAPVLQILETAKMIARSLGHDCLATEHVFLAILESSPNDASVALKRCGVSIHEMGIRLRSLIQTRDSQTTELERLPQTPGLIAAFRFAEEDLVHAGGIVALLLGLVREQASTAGLFLASIGITEIKLRNAARLQDLN
jgi:hypothetical protein